MSADHQQFKGLVPAIETAPRSVFGRRCSSSLTSKLGATAIAALLALVATVTTSHALTCVPPDQPTAMVLCKDGVCEEGFAIEYISNDRNCEHRPVVRELSKTDLGFFADNGRLAYRGHLSGVYDADVDHVCLRYRSGRERCSEPISIRKVSESVDPRTFDAYRSKWLDTERRAYRSHLIKLWKSAAATLSFTVLIIGWPWALGALIPAFRRYAGWTLLIAIPIQLLMSGIFWEIFAQSNAPLPVFSKWTGMFCAAVMIAAIPVQLRTLIRCKFKARARLA